MSRRRLSRRAFAVLTVALVVSLVLGRIEQAAAQSEHPKVGLLLPLSGGYASVGNDNRQGVEAALALGKRSRPFELLYADTMADPTTAVTEFRKLIDTSGVLAVYAMRGPVGMTLNPLSRSSIMPLLGGVGIPSFTESNPHAFQLWPTSTDEGTFLAEHLVAHGFQKLALLTAQDDWPVAVSNSLRAALKPAPLTIVFDQEIIPPETDFRSAVLQLNAKHIDVVFANLSIAQLGPFLKQAKALKFSGAIYSNFWVAKNDVVSVVGSAGVENVRFVEMDGEMPALRKLLAEKFGSEPSGATISAYAAILLLGQALGHSPPPNSPAELSAVLAEQREISTPDGPIPLVDRRAKFKLAMKVMRGGKPERDR